jgi:hypothetical protein
LKFAYLHLGPEGVLLPLSAGEDNRRKFCGRRSGEPGQRPKMINLPVYSGNGRSTIFPGGSSRTPDVFFRAGMCLSSTKDFR